MTFLSGIAGLAFVFATMVLFWWHSPLDVRVCLAGIYILTGTVSTIGAAVLWELKFGKRHQGYRECGE